MVFIPDSEEETLAFINRFRKEYYYYAGYLCQCQWHAFAGDITFGHTSHKSCTCQCQRHAFARHAFAYTDSLSHKLRSTLYEIEVPYDLSSGTAGKKKDEEKKKEKDDGF